MNNYVVGVRILINKIKKLLPRRLLRGQKMSQQTRKDVVKIILADAVTDVMEDLIHHKKITREEAIYWYARIAKQCIMYDLIPKKVEQRMPTPALKKMIRKRLGTHSEPKFVDPTPPPVKKLTLVDLAKRRAA